MTLKEKFNKITCSDCDMPYCDIKCTILKPSELNHLEQIADEFAIGFAEWLVENDLYDEILLKVSDAKELLEIYKKESNL
jgi:hypothetical protein